MVVEGQSAERLDVAGLRQLFDSANVAMVAVDEDLSIQYCSPATAMLLGTEGSNGVGEPLRGLVAGPGGLALERHATRALREGLCTDLEFRQDDETGPRFVSVSIWPVYDEGFCCGAALCFRDVSGSIRVHESLGQRRKMCALARMAGSLAHHFNNILGSVVTRIDFVRTSSDVRVLRRSLDSTAQALQRATGVLDGLLAFAEADHRDEDLADLTETMINFLEQAAPTLRNKRITLQLSLPEVPIVEVPVQRFTTVLRNVVDNAVEAMTAGGCLGVELEPGEADVTLRISDTGCGLSGEQLDQVFEPFYSTKTRDTAAGPERHAGLGLSVALGIVHELGGEMSMASKSGECTVVEIQLPMEAGAPLRQPGRAMQSHADLPRLEELGDAGGP